MQQLEQQLAGKQKELAGQPRKIQLQVEMSRLEREAQMLRQSTEKMQVRLAITVRTPPLFSDTSFRGQPFSGQSFEPRHSRRLVDTRLRTSSATLPPSRRSFRTRCRRRRRRRISRRRRRVSSRRQRVS